MSEFSNNDEFPPMTAVRQMSKIDPPTPSQKNIPKKVEPTSSFANSDSKGLLKKQEQVENKEQKKEKLE